MTLNPSDNLPSPRSAVILIPAFNEADVVAQVIGEVRAVCDLPIIVVDDASTDDTRATAREAGALVIPLPIRLGAWVAVQTGLRYALRHGYDVVITMDADGQHEASSLEALAGPVMRGAADVAIGACLARGSALRKIAWVLMKNSSGLAMEDITSGFRVYNRRAISILCGWRATLLDYQDIGVLLLLQRHGLEIVDVDVCMQSRRNGSSRVFSSWLLVCFYMCHSLLLGFSKRAIGRPRPP